MGSKINKKIILDQIPTNYQHKDDQIIKTVFTHKVASKSINELIIEGTEDIHFAATVKNTIKKNMQNFSKQQVDFAYETSRLITGELKEKKPVLVPVRCGFGKSTFINTLVYEKIQKQKRHEEPLQDLGIIVVTERLEDLRELQGFIQETCGLYNHFQYDDVDNVFHEVEVPWMYIMESWNEGIECRKHIKTYEESLEQCNQCEFKSKCKLGKQQRDQFYSPIIGITAARFYYYADAGILFKIRKWKSKGENGIKLNRELLLIDEKPKLTKVNNVSEKTIDEIKDAISRIDEHGDFLVRKDKEKLKTELDNVKKTLQTITSEFHKYRNAYIKLNQKILSNDFMNTWNEYRLLNVQDKLDAIADIFNNGAVFCKTGKYDIFKTVSMANFKVDEFKTVIFDGTAELSLEYDEEDFNIMNVDDLKEYSNVTFHLVEGNYPKGKVKKNLEQLKPIVKWIDKNINTELFLVSYKAASNYLYDLLKENNYVISYKDNKKKKCIPYFGYTKGMNNFNKCTKMIQIGWNRWDSDSYISYRIATSKVIKNNFNDKYETHFDKIQELMENDNGKFKFSDIEMYKLMHMINDFEQEVFRTKVREFTSEDKVDIYIFNCNKTMEEMIKQRFKNCAITLEKWNEITEYNLRKRKNADNMIVLKFYDWLNNWDGDYMPIKELRNKIGITNGYWKKIKKKPLIKEIWDRRLIRTQLHGGDNCIIAYG